MKAYSEDLRKRVIAAYEESQNIAAVARRFNVGRPTIHDWLKLYSETGSLTPLPRSGRPRLIKPEFETVLVKQIQTYPDASLSEHSEKWDVLSGVKITPSALSRIFKRLGWTRKKKRWVRLNETTNSVLNLPKSKNE